MVTICNFEFCYKRHAIATALYIYVKYIPWLSSADLEPTALSAGSTLPSMASYKCKHKSKTGVTHEVFVCMLYAWQCIRAICMHMLKWQPSATKCDMQINAPLLILPKITDKEAFHLNFSLRALITLSFQAS